MGELFHGKKLHKGDAVFKWTRWHTAAFAQKRPEELVHCTQSSFHPPLPTHTKARAYIQKLLQREIFTLRSIYTMQKTYITKHDDKQKLVHKDAFTHSFYTRKLWCSAAFTQSSFYTEDLFQILEELYTGKSFQRSFHTQELLHRDIYTQGSFRTCTRLPLSKLKKNSCITAFIHSTQ